MNESELPGALKSETRFPKHWNRSAPNQTPGGPKTQKERRLGEGSKGKSACPTSMRSEVRFPLHTSTPAL